MTIALKLQQITKKISKLLHAATTVEITFLLVVMNYIC